MEDIKHLVSSDWGVLSDDLYERRVYSKDLWPKNLILAREADPKEYELHHPTIDLIFWPTSPMGLSSFLKLSNERGWQVYPYGAGSGVCGGAAPGPADRTQRNTQIKICIDLKRLDQVGGIDPESQVVKVGAGIIGQVLEERLNAQGYTMGHFPSSIYCSSFGGYLATRAAGQFSTFYGKIEDIVLGIEGVLPTGEFFSTPVAPRSAIGPDLNGLFIGSEGVFAVLTAAWVKIHKLPELRTFQAFKVSSTAQALRGIALWMQSGLRPAVVRLYDEEESRLLHGLKSGVKVIVICEGESTLTDFTAQQIERSIQSSSDWTSLGEEPAQHWWSHRYDISYRQQQIMSHQRMILDTFEVSTVWSKLSGLHQKIKNVVNSLENKEFAIILAHFSHFYHTGGNIYFTVCGRSKAGSDTEKLYDQIWDKMMNACYESGAALSHHHGIGRLKAEYFKKQRGELFSVLEKLKNEMDPKHILNSKNLGL